MCKATIGLAAGDAHVLLGTWLMVSYIVLMLYNEAAYADFSCKFDNDQVN